MLQFEILVERVSSEFHTFTVKAKNREEANKIAIEKAEADQGGLKWEQGETYHCTDDGWGSHISRD